MKIEVELILREADERDLDLLAAMNERLVVDQGSQPWSRTRFRERFDEWIRTGDWSIYIFCIEDEAAGYVAYQVQPDHYNPDENVVFVRHFYVERASRRRGIGTRAFNSLRELLPPGWPISLEVVSTNPDGQRFWEGLGFARTFTSLKLSSDR